jgi:hypothetical protein
MAPEPKVLEDVGFRIEPLLSGSGSDGSFDIKKMTDVDRFSFLAELEIVFVERKRSCNAA